MKNKLPISALSVGAVPTGFDQYDITGLRNDMKDFPGYERVNGCSRLCR